MNACTKNSKSTGGGRGWGGEARIIFTLVSNSCRSPTAMYKGTTKRKEQKLRKQKLH